MVAKGIKVALAFSNNLISQGIHKILDETHDFVETRILEEKDCTPRGFNLLKDHIILTDFQCLYNVFPHVEDVECWPKIILLDTNCGKENITMAVLKKRLCGVIPGTATIGTLVKSLKHVHNGEVWLENEIVKGVLNGIGIKNGKANPLTAREKEIVSLIGKGYRNKEIAKKLHISEQTVKTHLYRIFQKLNIKSRSELIAFALRSSGAIIIPLHRDRAGL